MAANESGAGELRVEHVLAALDQITTLSAQVRNAMSGMDPKTVLAGGTSLTLGPTGKPTVGHCMPAPVLKE